MQKRINRIISYTSFFAMILIIESCKKEISIEKYSNIKISEKFFTHESSTNKIVLRVIDEIKRRNNKSEFVSKFAICNGFPIWNKAIISSSSNQFSKESSTNNLENTQSDTFAYFPLVIENSDKINGFILAKINNGIDLIYSLSKDYKAFSFNNDGSNLNDASKFVLTNLLLNKEVFGVAEYKITDYRLFTGDPEHDKVSKLSIQGQLNAADCAIISWSTQHCETPYTTQCRNGCDNCGYPVCYPENSSIEICSAPNGVNWPSGGIDIGISGGVSTDGTGGGEASGGDGGIGGAEIPHYYPCQSNPIPKSMDQIPPCPEPGPGNGWSPIIEIVPDLEIIGNFEDDPYIFQDDPSAITFDYNQNQWPTISNVISTRQFVGYDGRTNCLTLAKAQIAVAGVQDLGYASAYQIFNALGGPYPGIAKSGVDYIITKLLVRIPVIVGVDNEPGTPSQQNSDGMTDHFVTIVGCGQDTRGKYFTFFDNATNYVSTGTSPSNKLYYNETSGIISGQSATTYASLRPYNYKVTQIRKNR